MEWLRWILLALGLALIGAVYWSGRRRSSPDGTDTTPVPATSIEPVSQSSVSAETGTPGLESAELESAETEPPGNETPGIDPKPARAAPADTQTPAGPAGRLVTLYLAAAPGERLIGSQLAAAFERHGLEHGELDIFHAREAGGTLFSVANGVEPGTFNPVTMDVLSTPGVALFLRLPAATGPDEAAFGRMLATARSLAAELGARLLDENHAILTPQTEQYLRDELRRLEMRRGNDR